MNIRQAKVCPAKKLEKNFDSLYNLGKKYQEQILESVAFYTKIVLRNGHKSWGQLDKYKIFVTKVANKSQFTRAFLELKKQKSSERS